MTRQTTQDLIILGLKKDREQYVLIYQPSEVPEVLRTLGRWAGNPELNLNWADAACLSTRVRQSTKSTDWSDAFMAYVPAQQAYAEYRHTGNRTPLIDAAQEFGRTNHCEVLPRSLANEFIRRSACQQ